MMNISLPTLVDAFQSNVGDVQWVISAYSITMAGLLLTFGRLADMIGHKRMFILGFVVFGVGSYLCGISNVLLALVLARVVQAAGAAMLVGNGTAAIAAAFPSEERGRALGLNSFVVGLGSLSAPTIGGLLIQRLGWRSMFSIHPAISVIGVIVTVVLFKDTATHKQQEFDLLGAASLATMLVCLATLLSQGQRMQNPLFLVLLGAGAIAAGAVLVWSNGRVREPVLDLRLLRNRLFALSNACVFIESFALTSTNLTVPFFLQKVLGYPLAATGLFMVIQPALQLTIAPISGWLADRVDCRLIASTGMVIEITGMLLLSLAGPQASAADVAFRLALLGLGAGLAATPNQAAVMGAVPRGQLGTGSGFVATMRHIGLSTSAALVGPLFAARTAVHTGALLGGAEAGEMAVRQAMAHGFRDALWVVMGLYVVGIALSWLRGPDKRCPTLPA